MHDVTVVSKNDHYVKPNNYRQIRILSILSKVLENKSVSRKFKSNWIIINYYSFFSQVLRTLSCKKWISPVSSFDLRKQSYSRKIGLHSKQNKLYYQTFLSSAGSTVLPADRNSKPVLRDFFKIRGKNHFRFRRFCRT
jgi:hypothetical protein